MRKRDLGLVFGIFAGGYMAGNDHMLDNVKIPHIGINAPTITPTELTVELNKVGLKQPRSTITNLSLCDTAKRIGFVAKNNRKDDINGALCETLTGSRYIVIKTP